jgi:RNA polymerase sigma-70 factor (ECF subfamily)
VVYRSESARSQYQEIFRFVRRRVGSTTDAEDLTQEVFAGAAEKLSRSAADVPPTAAWLYTVARRRLADHARRRRLDTVPIELVADPAAPEEQYGTRVASLFDTALASMAESHRRVVVLRLLEGRSFAEIGRELGVGETACRVRFMRGLEHLRAVFEREGLTP